MSPFLCIKHQHYEIFTQSTPQRREEIFGATADQKKMVPFFSPYALLIGDFDLGNGSDGDTSAGDARTEEQPGTVKK
jgi:hypothetical protein